MHWHLIQMHEHCSYAKVTQSHIEVANCIEALTIFAIYLLLNRAKFY